MGGKLRRQRTRAWSPLFLLSQLSSDFTGTRILFVILRVVDVVRMAEQERNCILSWLLLRRSGHRHAENGLPAWIKCWLTLLRRLTLIIEEHGGEPSKQCSRNWLILSPSNSHHGFTKYLDSYNEVARPGPAHMAAAGQRVRTPLGARSYMTSLQ